MSSVVTTFFNHSNIPLLCGITVPRVALLEKHVLQPGSSYSLQDSCRRRLHVHLSDGDVEKCEDKDQGPLQAEVVFTLRSHKPPRSWRAVKVDENCRWRVYEEQTQQGNTIDIRVHIYPRRDLSRFLADMDDDIPLYDLCLPGTHDTMAFYGWPVSQCQALSTPLSVQLESGIRVIDIRLAVKPKSIPPQLVAYHGVYPQRTPFQDILNDIYQFLTGKGSRETLVMSLKQEDFNRTRSTMFSRLVREEIERSVGGLDLFVLNNRIPKLGEVRGKVILFSRFGGNGDGWEDGLGIHPTTWPDSEKSGFEWVCNGVTVRTHDWYAIPSFLAIPEKVALATQVLLPPTLPATSLAISYFSAASFPLAVPPVIACGFGWPQWNLGVEGVNSRVGRWLLETLSSDKGVRGWTLMDFYECPQGGSIIPLLVECNYHGRATSQEKTSYEV